MSVAPLAERGDHPVEDPPLDTGERDWRECPPAEGGERERERGREREGEGGRGRERVG